MAFTLNAQLTGVFPMPSGGQTSQSLPLTQQALTTLVQGLNPDGTPAASVSAALPNPQKRPITRTPFTIAGIIESAKANPLITGAVALGVAFLVWRAVK